MRRINPSPFPFLRCLLFGGDCFQSTTDRGIKIVFVGLEMCSFYVDLEGGEGALENGVYLAALDLFDQKGGGEKKMTGESSLPVVDKGSIIIIIIKIKHTHRKTAIAFQATKHPNLFTFVKSLSNYCKPDNTRLVVLFFALLSKWLLLFLLIWQSVIKSWPPLKVFDLEPCSVWLRG